MGRRQEGPPTACAACWARRRFPCAETFPPGLQRRGALWSVGLSIITCFVITNTNFLRLRLASGAMSFLCFWVHLWALYEV